MKKLCAISLLPLFLASCAQDSLTGDTVSRYEAGRAQEVRFGTITSIRPVKIEGGSTGGTLVGAGIGGLLGNQIGGGSGKTAATVAGALAGGALGSHAGQNVTSRPGLEIEVRLEGGEGGGSRISVVQESNPRESFAVGDRVRVITGGGGRTRVAH
ncbi:MAG: glycine zipper 2TM domain-containing protein [Luteolibacter sp.]